MLIDTLTVIQQIVTIIALASGAIVAWLGLATWRRQIVGKTEHDLAQRTLKLVFQFRETVYWVRTLGVLEDTNVRSQTISASMAELAAILPEVEALWGKEIRNSIHKFNLMGYRILASLELERRGEIKEQEKKDDPILIGAVDKSDQFSQELDQIVEVIRVNLQSKLNLVKSERKRRKQI